MFGCRPIWKIDSVEQDKRSMVGCFPIQKSVWVKQEKQLMGQWVDGWVSTDSARCLGWPKEIVDGQ
jgi:hypothetical protein